MFDGETRSPRTVDEAVEMLRPYVGDAADLFLEVSDSWNWPGGCCGVDDDGRRRFFHSPFALVVSLLPNYDDFDDRAAESVWNRRVRESGLVSGAAPTSWCDPEEWRLSRV